MGKKNKKNQNIFTSQSSSPNSSFAKSKVEKKKNSDAALPFSEKKKKLVSKQEFKKINLITSPGAINKQPSKKNKNKSKTPANKQVTLNQPVNLQLKNQESANIVSKNKTKNEESKVITPRVSVGKMSPKANQNTAAFEGSLSKKARRRLRKQQQEKNGSEDFIPLVSATNKKAEGQSNLPKKIKSKNSPQRGVPGISGGISRTSAKAPTSDSLDDKSIYSSESDDGNDSDNSLKIDHNKIGGLRVFFPSLKMQDSDEDEPKIPDDSLVKSESSSEEEDSTENSDQEDNKAFLVAQPKFVDKSSARKRKNIEIENKLAKKANINQKNNGVSAENSSEDEDNDEEEEEGMDGDEDDSEVDAEGFIDEEADEGEETDDEDSANAEVAESENEEESNVPRNKKTKFSHIDAETNIVEYKVFINKIPFEATEDKLREALSEVGEISSITLPQSRDYEGQCRGFAFLTLPDKETFEKIIKLDQAAEISGQPLGIREYVDNDSRSPGSRGGFSPGRGFDNRGGGRFRGGREEGFRGGRGRGFRGGRGGGFRGGRGGGFRGGRGGGFRGSRGEGFRGSRGEGFRGSRGEGFRGAKRGNTRDGSSKEFQRGGFRGGRGARNVLV